MKNRNPDTLINYEPRTSLKIKSQKERKKKNPCHVLFFYKENSPITK